MTSKGYPQGRRSAHLRRRAQLAIQGRAKKSVLFGWFRVRREPLMSSTGEFGAVDPAERTHNEPLPTGAKLILILAIIVFLFITLIPLMALIKLLFTPG